MLPAMFQLNSIISDAQRLLLIRAADPQLS